MEQQIRATELKEQEIRAFLESRDLMTVPDWLRNYRNRPLPGEDRRAILEVICHYREGWVPLITPVTLLRYHLRRLGHPWVDSQVYLHPHPAELGCGEVCGGGHRCGV